MITKCKKTKMADQQFCSYRRDKGAGRHYFSDPGTNILKVVKQ